MKVVLSRKGFDASAGGYPSPIINGQPISLPIPYSSSLTSFEEVGLGNLVTDLTKNRISSQQGCHLDPDLELGAFGQESAAQSHLDNHNIGIGDLFLFFGWFREAEFSEGKYRYKKGSPDHHRIFGWLFVDKKITLGSKTREFRTRYSDYANHPHANGEWGLNNTIYTAPKDVNLFNQQTVPGFGRFRESSATLLTDREASSKSYWRVPDWLNPHKGGCIPSYHSDSRYIGNILRTVGRGQEFVCEPKQDPNFTLWLMDVFDGSLGNAVS